MELCKNLILEGVFSVETPDTSGEVLCIDGADISDLETGKAPLNTEHINPDDADKEDMHKDEKAQGFQGFASVVGRVVRAKKIMSERDCHTDKERKAWNDFRKPMIYGAVEIWDGPEAHDNARAAASIARMFSKSQGGPQLGLSVEGATVKREGNYLRKTVIRKMALTMKPANKAATIDIVADSASGVPKSMSKAATTEGGLEPLRKSVAMDSIQVIVPTEVFKDFGLSSALSNLRKALTAGTPSGAPGSLTGGEALQKESQLAKLVKLVGRKRASAGLIKSFFPGVSDADASKIEQAVHQKQMEKTLQMTQDLFDEIWGKGKKK